MRRAVGDEEGAADGPVNGVIIRKKGKPDEITQTYTDFSTKHDSS